MYELLIVFMGLAIVVLSVLITVIGRASFNRGFNQGLEAKIITLPPSGPFVCPHVWGLWSKAKWTISRDGYGRVQRRVCDLCGEEQEREC